MPAGSQLRRLFFALWPPEALCERLELKTRTLVQDSGGRAIPPRNFHVTVVFLGEVPQSCLTAVLAAAAATSSPAFTLTLDRIDVWSRSSALVLRGAATPPELATLVTRLRISLLSRQIKLSPGVRSSPGVYCPHITLARNLPRASPVSGQPLPAMVGNEAANWASNRASDWAADWSIGWQVSEFVLIDSVVTPGGSDYQVLGCWPLA